MHVVWEFRGEVRGLEQQPLAWVSAANLAGHDFPAANLPIVEAVQALLRSE